GRLHLDDEIDGAHVDPELEAAGSDEGGKLARLQKVLDLEPLLAGDRPVVTANELVDDVGSLLLGVEFIEAVGEALGEAPGVDEDQRAAVGPNEVEQQRV